MYLSKIACVKLSLECKCSKKETFTFQELTFPDTEQRALYVVGNLKYATHSLFILVKEHEGILVFW